MGACMSVQNVQTAVWSDESGKPARSGPPSQRRACGSGPLTGAPAACDIANESLASPSLSVGSSLYSLYTEPSSQEEIGLAAGGPTLPCTPDAAQAALVRGPPLPVVVSSPMQGVTLGAVLGRWGDGLTYHGTWNGQAVAVTISQHGLDSLNKAKQLEQHLRRAACSADLRHPCLSPLYCCSLVRHAEDPDAVVCDRCAADTATSGEICDHEMEGAEWRQYLSSGADGGNAHASGATRLEVWAVSELGFCTLEGALLRGWLHFDSTNDGPAAAAGEPKRPRLRRILNVAHDIASGLQFMHSKGLVHGELSGATVTVCSGKRGYSAKLGSALHHATRAASALERRGMEAPRKELLVHTAPELLLRGEEPSPKADVYALGTCLWEMFSGKLACPQLHPVALLRAHHARSSPLAPLDHCPPAFQALVSACMAPDAADRPDCTEVLARLDAMLADQ